MNYKTTLEEFKQKLNRSNKSLEDVENSHEVCDYTCEEDELNITKLEDEAQRLSKEISKLEDKITNWNEFKDLLYKVLNN